MESLTFNQFASYWACFYFMLVGLVMIFEGFFPTVVEPGDDDPKNDFRYDV